MVRWLSGRAGPGETSKVSLISCSWLAQKVPPKLELAFPNQSKTAVFQFGHAPLRYRSLPAEARKQ